MVKKAEEIEDPEGVALALLGFGLAGAGIIWALRRSKKTQEPLSFHFEPESQEVSQEKGGYLPLLVPGSAAPGRHPNYFEYAQRRAFGYAI